MKRNATILTRDLEESLDLLEGLQLIMKTFHEEERGRHSADPLLNRLQAMDSHGMNWEPLRYQLEGGQGWQHMVTEIAELRSRLLEGYADAAL